MCLILLLASVHEEPANFYREKGRVAFVTGHFFTFLVVLSLICLATTQILICGNQTIWTLEILIRTTVAALFKTKDIKKRERNISQWCKWSWKMRVTNVLRLEQYLMPDYAHPAHPLPHKHSHTNLKRTLSAQWHLPILPPAHTTLFPILITTNAQVFLSHNCPKIRENLSISLESSHKPNTTVPIFNKSKKSLQT